MEEKKEYLDIVDENNNPTGMVVERDEAHERNLYHRHVMTWIMNEKGEVLLQKRSDNKNRHPGEWAKTGGHVESGETVEEALQREAKEEVGALISKENIELIGIFRSHNPANNFFVYSFITTVNYKIEDFKLQREEVNEIRYFTIEELEQAKKEKSQEYVFSRWTDEEFNEEIEKLKERRDKILNK